ncbi:hypothetical protein ACKKBG_A29005 [Auxenochlorella protothecoides x Auxenochlorella symbiontica]
MDEESFPRGGGFGMDPIEQKKLKRDAFAEAELELAGQKSKKSRPTKEAHENEDAFFETLSAAENLPKYAELLKFKILGVGARVWGAIIEVSERELVVSMPHGLRGHVPAAAAGEPGMGVDLLAAFNIGQLVRAQITQLTGAEAGEDGAVPPKDGKKRRKKVYLTLAPSAVNAGLDLGALVPGFCLSASVQSMEDHGAVLSFGIKGTTGFLPAAAFPERPLIPGTLLDVVVTSKKAGGRITVDAGSEAVAAAKTEEWIGMHIGALLPGSLVAATVRDVLSDGVVLSFLTFFSGTVDPFHLNEPGSDKKRPHSKNQRVKARILYVDPESKKIVLTMQRGLVAGQLPPDFPAMGQVFAEATVLRIDPGLGLLCSLPSAAGQVTYPPGFAHISNTLEGRVKSLEKAFTVGQKVKARVIGFRPLDGLAVLTLRPSVVEQLILSHADLHPGMPVTGKVAAVEDFGLLLEITPSVRALVPLIHGSDVGTKKGLRKHKLGQSVSGIVLSVQPGAKKLSITLKPSLLGSKLRRITSQQDVVAGMRSHGTISGMTEKAVFVEFFNGVRGMVPLKECALTPEQKPSDAYVVGQVVKARVLGVDAKGRGLKLSLASTKKLADGEKAGAGGAGEASPIPAAGTFVYGKVRKLITGESAQEGAEAPLKTLAVELRAEADVDSSVLRGIYGRLEIAHLADHPCAAAALVENLRVGLDLGRLLVLRAPEAGTEHKALTLTRKAALVEAAAAGKLPATLEAAKKGRVMPGYIASITKDAVFVRFLGALTARVGLVQISDGHVSDPAAVYSPGQTVRAKVVGVDAASGHVSAELKQSTCASAHAEYLASYFKDIEMASSWAEDPTDVAWEEQVPIGGAVQGSVHEVKDYGTLCDLDVHPDIVGVAAPHQVEGEAAQGPVPGTRISALVLDRNPADGIVDLSLLPRLTEAEAAAKSEPSAKKGKRKGVEAASPKQPKLGDQLECVIELVKEREGYCVVSLPAGCQPRIGFVPSHDFNSRAEAVSQTPGDSIVAKVAALPRPGAPRLLFSVPLAATTSTPAPAGEQAENPEAEAKRARLAALPKPGTILTAHVEAVHALHADLALDGDFAARLHITNAEPTIVEVGTSDAGPEPAAAGVDAPAGALSPLSSLKPGDSLRVAVLGRAAGREARRAGVVEVSTRAAALAGEAASGPAPPTWRSLRPGQTLPGYVAEVGPAGVWVALSPALRGLADPALAAASPAAAAELGDAFKPGQPVRATVARVDAPRTRLDLSLNGIPPPPAPLGALVVARVLGVSGGAVQLSLGAGARGRVPLADVHDELVADATAGLEAGQWVRARVTGAAPEAGGVATLSLRPASGGECAAHAAARPPMLPAGEELPAPLPRGATPASLLPNQRVAGYVRGAGPAGVFLALGRALDGRLRLSKLNAEGSRVEDVQAAFPVGRLVLASVIRVQDGKVELTRKARKTRPERDVAALGRLAVGDAVKALVRRVENFGLILDLEGGASGLAHISQLADTRVKNPGSLFSPGQSVLARVLKIDLEKGRVSLGLKPSYFEGDLAVAAEPEQAEGTDDEAAPASDFEDELAETQDASAELDSDAEAAPSDEEFSLDLDEELQGSGDE